MGDHSELADEVLAFAVVYDRLGYEECCTELLIIAEILMNDGSADRAGEVPGLDLRSLLDTP